MLKYLKVVGIVGLYLTYTRLFYYVFFPWYVLRCQDGLLFAIILITFLSEWIILFLFTHIEGDWLQIEKLKAGKKGLVKYINSWRQGKYAWLGKLIVGVFFPPVVGVVFFKKTPDNKLDRNDYQHLIIFTLFCSLTWTGSILGIWTMIKNII